MLGVPARDIRPDPVGTDPLPVVAVGVLPADGAGVEPRNTEPARGLCCSPVTEFASAVAVVAPAPERSTEAWREANPPLRRLAARA